MTTATATIPQGRIAFQGEPGAYSHQACRQARPEMEAVPCATFEDVIDQTRRGTTDLGMLAVENSTYGRVADVDLIGSGQSDLDALVAAVAMSQGRTAKPDGNPASGSYFRSDHFPLAKRGVPMA